MGLCMSLCSAVALADSQLEAVAIEPPALAPNVTEPQETLSPTLLDDEPTLVSLPSASQLPTILSPATPYGPHSLAISTSTSSPAEPSPHSERITPGAIERAWERLAGTAHSIPLAALHVPYCTGKLLALAAAPADTLQPAHFAALLSTLSGPAKGRLHLLATVLAEPGSGAVTSSSLSAFLVSAASEVGLALSQEDLHTLCQGMPAEGMALHSVAAEIEPAFRKAFALAI